MNYDFIINKNIRDYRNKPDYEIKSENSSINSDNNKDNTEDLLINKKNSDEELSNDNNDYTKIKILINLYQIKKILKKIKKNY